MPTKIDIESATSEDLAAAVVKDEKLMAQVVEAISGDNRRMRQRCAGALAIVSREQPEVLVPYAHDLCDALYRPEARTRWEVLEALTNLVAVDARMTDKALSGAESSLYDEESAPVRLAAFRFLAAYGATTENRAVKVWPLLDEAIQCYHGDPEFQDMLVALLGFAEGKAGKETKSAIVSRMKFDAENGRGILGKRAKQIIDAASGKQPKAE